jgi:hypothetical protein
MLTVSPVIIPWSKPGYHWDSIDLIGLPRNFDTGFLKAVIVSGLAEHFNELVI